LTMYAAVYRSN